MIVRSEKRKLQHERSETWHCTAHDVSGAQKTIYGTFYGWLLYIFVTFRSKSGKWQPLLDNVFSPKAVGNALKYILVTIPPLIEL